MIEGDPVGFDGEPFREPPLERDRHVAEADGPVAVVQERLRHEPGGIGEVDEPRARSATPRRLLGEFEHDRHRAERLRESSCARGLLADEPESSRDRLVGQARGLASDPELHDHEVRAFECFVTTRGEDEPAGPSHTTEHPVGEGSHDLQAFGVGIQQDELVDRQPVGAGHQPLDQLRRVRASPTGDGHLHTHGTASYTAAVKSLGKFPDPFSAEIAGQPEALRRAAAGLRGQREALRTLGGLVANGTVILTGMGGSYAACYPLAADLAEAGLTAVMLGCGGAPPLPDGDPRLRRRR